VPNIHGNHETREVTVDGRTLNPRVSQKLRNHSPDGFMWGYHGSGPAQLALSVLLLVADEDFALRNYQAYKSDVIAMFNQYEDFDLDTEMVRAWVAHRGATNA
jgi:hypothetical protein